MINLLRNILKKYWGYDEFRPLQEEIISSVMNQKDTLAILPTGGGKSVCFQVPALAMGGVCVVVSPLISLMHDQVGKLKLQGIKAVALAGEIDKNELEQILNDCISGEYKFLYIAPERLKNKIVQQKLPLMNIKLIAIDEAHCVSHWGKDFRPDYLNCGLFKTWFPTIPLIALTASATPNDVEFIKKNLKINGAKVFNSLLKRDNLSYIIRKTPEKFLFLQKILEKISGTAIVYVSSRNKTTEISQMLTDWGVSATFFHGQLPNELKKKNMNLWLKGKKRVMVATNAFGMGIDKPDVRSVTHWGLPFSLEDYFQESGRAGRDGEKSYVFLMYDEQDLQDVSIKSAKDDISAEFLVEVLQKLYEHLQIRQGEGGEQTFFVNFTDFTKKFELNLYETKKVLNFLERNQILEIHRENKQRASLKLISSQREILDFIKQAPHYRELLYALMRNYEGVFREFITFDPEELAQEQELTLPQLQKKLEILQQWGLLNFQLQGNTQGITFGVDREEFRTLVQLSEKLKNHNENKKNQATWVKRFVEDKNQCKQRFLVSYFKQHLPEDCQNCSYCRASKNLEAEVLRAIRKTPISLPELKANIYASDEEIISVVKKLVDNQKIIINQYNEYLAI